MTNDEQIAASIAAYNRRKRRIDELNAEYSPPDHCCASCASQEFRDLTTRQARAAIQLVSKLRRRNAVGDADVIVHLFDDYPDELHKAFPGVRQ